MNVFKVFVSDWKLMHLRQFLKKYMGILAFMYFSLQLLLVLIIGSVVILVNLIFLLLCVLAIVAQVAANDFL